MGERGGGQACICVSEGMEEGLGGGCETVKQASKAAMHFVFINFRF